MIPIDNSNLLNYRHTGTEGFTPALSYVYDPVAKTVTAQDGSVIPANDALKIVHVKVHDCEGKEVRGEITTTGAAGKVVMDVSSLDTSKGLNLTATVLTVGMLAADGSAFNIQTAGNAGKWDAQSNA